MRTKLHRNIELRKLPAGSLYNIAYILEINKDWQKFAPLIPKNPQSEHFERKYNWEEISLIEKHAKDTNRYYAQVLFDEWATSGMVRPTLDTLMKILQQAEIFRAVDEIARMLGEPPPPRPEVGPPAPITTSLRRIINNGSVETEGSDNLQNSSQDHDSTRQLEEPSNMIVITETNPSEVIPNIRALQSVGYQDEESGNVPDISALLAEPVIHDDNLVSTILTESNNTEGTSASTTDSSAQNEISIFIFSMIDAAVLEDKTLIPFKYSELEAVTDNFYETLVQKPKGPVGKIGSGGFGDVYVGSHENHDALAIKRLRIPNQICYDFEIAMTAFNTEVKSLSHLRHENIVPIVGYSIDGPAPCIVCKYIAGGSLQEKIAAKVLTEQQTIDIMRKTAAGLKYIHHSERPLQPGEVLSETEPQSSKKSYYLHGDVKSANILLTKECVPKLCDFGLAKQLDTTLITSSLMGTSAYMAPEGFSGTITQKNDIFSFGIVLLELITGLKPIVTYNGMSINIKNYVEDSCPDGDITKLLERMDHKWTKAQKVYDLAMQCLEREKNERPSIDDVCMILNEINNNP